MLQETLCVTEMDSCIGEHQSREDDEGHNAVYAVKHVLFKGFYE